MTLKELHIGQSATVTTVGGSGSLRQHFLDMGLIPGAVVKLKKYAPMGDPMQLTIHGYELTLRLADADKIEITPDVPADDEEEEPRLISRVLESRAYTMTLLMPIPFQKERYSHSPLQETRIAERQRFSINLQVQISMWATSRVSPLTVRAELSEDRKTPKSPTFLASIRSLLTQARRL